MVQSKKGRVAVVTGAAKGLGRAFVERLAMEGATVIAVDHENAPGLTDHLRGLGAEEAAFTQADVSEPDQVERLAGDTLTRFGTADILVNNAGVCPFAPFLQVSLDDWRHVMAVNVESMFLTCQAFIPAMKQHRYGRIVNIATEMLGVVIHGRSPYIASKGAVIGLTRALANEFGADGVTANCLAPGLTRTPGTEGVLPQSVFQAAVEHQPIKRGAVPDDLTGAMSFLTSDDAAFITGQTLMVNGGSLKAV